MKSGHISGLVTVQNHSNTSEKQETILILVKPRLNLYTVRCQNSFLREQVRSSDFVFMGERVNEKAIGVLIYTAQACVCERGSRGPGGGGGAWKLDLKY